MEEPPWRFLQLSTALRALAGSLLSQGLAEAAIHANGAQAPAWCTLQEAAEIHLQLGMRPSSSL